MNILLKSSSEIVRYASLSDFLSLPHRQPSSLFEAISADYVSFNSNLSTNTHGSRLPPSRMSSNDARATSVVMRS